MAQIKWTEPALQDLNEIAEFISLDNHVAAKNLVKQVFQSTKRLADFPESGRVPPEMPSSNYREIIVGPCRVFYRYNESTIYLLYIMRSERKLRRYLLDSRKE